MSEQLPLAGWWIGPSQDETCTWCGKWITPDPEYVLTVDVPGEMQWWYGT